MFGESESESPRVGSPWDALLSLPSSPARSISRTPSNSDLSGDSETDSKRVFSIELPKLVPEAEAGNVEYKLQLISPTPERFLRLVTQLKWRLLEGGGQAFYELGVADSGQLVGLTRSNLEKSLETLEAMAGEIGASVIVVKEIEVPEGMWERAAMEGGVHVNNGELVQEKDTRSDLMINSSRESRKRLFRTRPTKWGAVEVVDTNHRASDSELEGTTTDDDFVLSVPSPPPPSSPEDGVFNFDLEISEVYKPFHSKNSYNTVPLTNAHRNGSMKKEKSSKLQSPKSKKTPQEKSVAKRSRRDESRLQDKQCPIAKSGKSTNQELLPPPVATPLKELETLHVSLQDAVAVTTTVEVSHPPEPRMIVEALVVRKLSTEEAFLDFGGFDLTD